MLKLHLCWIPSNYGFIKLMFWSTNRDIYTFMYIYLILQTKLYTWYFFSLKVIYIQYSTHSFPTILQKATRIYFWPCSWLLLQTPDSFLHSPSSLVSSLLQATVTPTISQIISFFPQWSSLLSPSPFCPLIQFSLLAQVCRLPLWHANTLTMQGPK